MAHGEQKDDRVHIRETDANVNKDTWTEQKFQGASGRTVDGTDGGPFTNLETVTFDETTTGLNTTTGEEETTGISNSTSEERSVATGEETTSGTSSGTNTSTMTDATEDTNTSTQKEDKGLVLKFRIPIQSKNPVSRI